MPLDVDFSKLNEEFDDISREEAKEAANRFYSASQEALFRGGDEQDYDVQSVARTALPPQWDESEGGYVLKYIHPASVFFEDGTEFDEPIKPKNAQALAFEWPEMKGVEFADTGKTFDEVFEDTWPTVFLPQTKPEGIEALRYMEAGEQAARSYLEGNRR